MRCEDILAFVKPQWVKPSRTGSNVAFCVTKASLEENRNIDSLYLYNNKNKKQDKIFEADKILSSIWGVGDDTIYSLFKEGNQYKISQYLNSQSRILIDDMNPIMQFALSPDESQLYHTVTKSSPDYVVKSRIEEGYVYDYEHDTGSMLYEHNYRHKEWEEIWCLNITSGKSELITSISRQNWYDHFDELIESMEVSPDGTKLLLEIHKKGRPDLGGTPFTRDVLVFDLIERKLYDPLNDSIYVEHAPCWVGFNTFVFQQISYLDKGRQELIWLYDMKSKSGNPLDWLKIPQRIYKFQWDDKNQILYGLSHGVLYKISLKEKRLEEIELPQCFDHKPSIDKQGRYLGFITESSNVAPEIALYDLIKKEQSVITHLNPQLASMALGKVEEIWITTSSGISASGFIVHPVNEKPGIRYPMVLASYGFSGTFITDAEWHSSFPAQTFAGKDYLVLLLNHPGSGQALNGDSEKAREIEGWNVLELFEKAVDDLVEKGIGDPEKVGIYGWSHGGFIVEFLLTHSKKFHVACVGEGGDYNPGGFWMGGMWHKIYDNMFGGPPWGHTLQNYLDFSPFFLVDKIRAPLLLEFSEATMWGFEMYSPLRYLGVPSEFVVYDGEEHNFVKPKARLASMNRKLEWFDYWFFDKRSNDANKAEQYRRWDSMREEAINRGLNFY